MGQAVTKQDTYTGNVVTFTNHGGAEIDSLSVPILPTQNLNGYSKPWAGGTGKNLLPDGTLSGDITITRNADGSYTMTGSTSASARIAIANFWDWGLPTSSQNDQTKHLPNGTYYANSGNPNILLQVARKNGSGTSGISYAMNASSGTFVIDDTYEYNWVRLNIPANVDPNVTLKPIICLNSESDKSFEPYRNICPISGSTGLSAYVSPTQNIADATTYNSDWNATAGTVYAGNIDIVSGALKARPQYALYNGETLVGPWLSSMDEYAVGVTPTTGAQVVDLGGTETTYTLTAQTIAALSDLNNIWASNNSTINVVVTDILAGFNGWLIKCVTNGTPVDIPLKYIRAETYTVTPDQRMEWSAERDVTGVLHRETVPNTPPKIEFNTPLMTNSDIEALNTIIRNAFTNVLGRDITIQYYNPEQNAYWEWDCYMPDVHYPIRNVDVANNVINYEELRYAFIGY